MTSCAVGFANLLDLIAKFDLIIAVSSTALLVMLVVSLSRNRVDFCAGPAEPSTDPASQIWLYELIQHHTLGKHTFSSRYSAGVEELRKTLKNLRISIKKRQISARNSLASIVPTLILEANASAIKEKSSVVKHTSTMVRFDKFEEFNRNDTRFERVWRL